MNLAFLKKWWDAALDFFFDTRRHYMRIIDDRDRQITIQSDTITWLCGELEKVRESEKTWARIAANDVGELREAKEKIENLTISLENKQTLYEDAVVSMRHFQSETGKLERNLKAANKKLAAYELPLKPAPKPAPKARKRKVVAE